QRRHLNINTDTGVRTIFFVDVDNKGAINVNDDPNSSLIMDKNDYSHSHQFVSFNSTATFIIYPSCRDPYKRDNAAVLDIGLLSKNPKWESSIKFFYDNQKQEINWLDYGLHINWREVS